MLILFHGHFGFSKIYSQSDHHQSYCCTFCRIFLTSPRSSAMGKMSSVYPKWLSFWSSMLIPVESHSKCSNTYLPVAPVVQSLSFQLCCKGSQLWLHFSMCFELCLSICSLFCIPLISLRLRLFSLCQMLCRRQRRSESGVCDIQSTFRLGF